MSEQSKGFLAANWFKLFFVALCLFLIALYFHRESQLDDCLQYTQEGYKKGWELECKQSKQDAQCSLPRMVAESLGKDRDRRVDECFKRYSLKQLLSFPVFMAAGGVFGTQIFIAVVALPITIGILV